MVTPPIPPSPPSHETTPNSTSTYKFSHEPFATYQHKVAELCAAIGLGQPTSIEQMKGGSYNRIIGLSFSSRPACIIRIPCDPGEGLENIKDQYAVTTFLHRTTTIPIPVTVAYDSTVDNVLESEYIIQQRISGVPLENIYHQLEPNQQEHIMHQVIALLVQIENISYPCTGQLVADKPPPDAMVVDSDSNIGVATAPFRPGLPKPLPPGPTPALIEDAFAERMRVWDAERETPLGQYLVYIWEKLTTIQAEMKSLGFFDDCNTQPNVLHHWDFEPRNIMVEGKTNGVYDITGVLDWDEVLCVPLVLARKPPAWLWMPPRKWTTSWEWWDSDIDELEPVTAELRTRFEEEISSKAAVTPGYVEDAFGKGRWIRRLWRYLLHGFQSSEDNKRFDRFVEEWNRLKSVGSDLTTVLTRTNGR